LAPGSVTLGEAAAAAVVALVVALVDADAVGLSVGRAGVVVGAAGGTYGVLVDTVECVGPAGGGLCDEPPELWLPPPPLCVLLGLCVGFGVGFLVGFFVGLWVGDAGGGGGGGGGAAVVGATVAVGVLVGVGVFCVGAATAAESVRVTAVAPVPAALCGHQATRQAARPSNAATAMRTMFVPVLLTTSS
jgi:hypothetical protein